MIDREALVEMFENIAERGEWDMSQPMLWGYFFTHSEAEALRSAAASLEAAGYEFVELWRSKPDAQDVQGEWWLHVQRVEVHTVDTLFARNEQLYEFAASKGLRSYDGMDVGPADAVRRPS